MDCTLGQKKTSFYEVYYLISKSSEPYSPLFKIFRSNRQFQKRMKLFSLYDFWPFHFLKSKQNHDKKLDRIISPFYLFIYYNFYLFFKPGPTVDCIVLHGFIVVANNDET